MTFLVATALRVNRGVGSFNQFGDTLDKALLLSSLTILALGLVMVASASSSIAERAYGDPFFYFYRQALFAGTGSVVGCIVCRMPLAHWQTLGTGLFVVSLVLLSLVFIPGVGKTVNGSTRWIPLGSFNLQVSELAKLFLLIYLAGYLVRHGEEVRSRLLSFIKPIALVCLVAILLLLEPDFGAAVIVLLTAVAVLFLGGVRLWQFGLLILAFTAVTSALAVSSPYRLQRITAFMDPWADPFNTGFQLTQSLIAIGSGYWGGVGLGSSVQKLFYLPEAHTDFLFAVLAEELGLIGVIFVISLYSVIVWRALRIAAMAESVGHDFAVYLAYGVAAWIGLQAFINIGVNMGLLPTKGLTLPLMSYGGSSLVVTCAAIGLLLRSHHEALLSQVQARRTRAGAGS